MVKNLPNKLGSLDLPRYTERIWMVCFNFSKYHKKCTLHCKYIKYSSGH